jgi:hypothetical protein
MRGLMGNGGSGTIAAKIQPRFRLRDETRESQLASAPIFKNEAALFHARRKILVRHSEIGDSAQRINERVEKGPEKSGIRPLAGSRMLRA